ncbi:MAG: signal recognition particle receptor subunit alpha, partial [Candidatus Omnitrophica bacterium]|nr:signal recognition particle receptor subunit alpha [Candidatus Omnitrophota bacterium]
MQKTQSKLGHEFKRIFTGSPKLTGAMLEELEGALLAADLSSGVANRLVTAVKHAYETQGGLGRAGFAIARRE